MLVFSNIGRKAICPFFRDQKTQVLSKESLYMWVVMYRMYWFVSGLSAMRLVVAVDVISLRVGRWRLPKKNFFRYLERGFAPWAVCLATVPKTPEELFIACESLLPGTVLGHADPQSWAQLFRPSPWTYSGICTWPLGSEALLFLQQSLLLLASDYNKTHPLTLVSFSTLLHQ